MQDIFDTYADYDGFMDYEVTGEFEADMTDYLATEGENLIASRNFAAAFELGQASYELLHEIDIDDSNGVMLTILTYITELWEEAMEFAPRIVKFADEKMQQIEAGDEFAYTFVLWLEIKLKFAANEKEREKVYQKYWDSPNVRNFKADILWEKGKLSDVEKLLQENLVIDQADPYWLSEWHELLKILYLQMQDIPKYEGELWALLLVHNKGSESIFLEMKNHFGAEKWLVVKEKIYQKLADSNEIEKLFALEADWRLLLDHTKQTGNFELVLRHAEEIKAAFPKELIQIFTEVIRAEAKTADTRPKYQQIAQKLQKLKKIPGGIVAASLLKEELLQKYPRRSAMKDELRRV